MQFQTERIHFVLCRVRCFFVDLLLFGQAGPLYAFSHQISLVIEGTRGEGGSKIFCHIFQFGYTAAHSLFRRKVFQLLIYCAFAARAPSVDAPKHALSILTFIQSYTSARPISSSISIIPTEASCQHLFLQTQSPPPRPSRLTQHLPATVCPHSLLQRVISSI